MKRHAVTRLAVLAAAFLACSGSASAYYYYLFFVNGTGNAGAPARYDLNALANGTLPFYISSQGPGSLTPGDSFQAIISELRTAANWWNSVQTSALRLSYGGLFTPGRIDNSPSIDVVFSNDVPPGLLAAGAPESVAPPVIGPNGTFVPITRSILLLPNNMTNLPVFGATSSYSEAFCVTLVHEFGHTLGLQHTLTSSVMSTLVTSTSSRSTPLAADDRAGISVLYPAANYLSSVGSISGRVTMNGAPVALASVVAISPSTPAISALTNPDGTYAINGIPPGQYSVYVHPLPPPDTAYGESTADNIYYPRDQNGNAIPPSYDPSSNTFAAQFYSGPAGTRNWQQAQPLQVTAGNAATGINFSVTQRSSEAVASVRIYGLTSSQPIIYSSPTPLMVDSTNPIPLVATGAGLLQSNQTVTPGLAVSTLGSIAQLDSPVAFPPPQPYIAVYVAYTSFGVAGGGVGHLLFSTPNDLYVLPSAFHTVAAGPPFIGSVTPTFDGNGNRAAIVAGSNFAPDTRILFDGLQGTIENVNPDGSLLVLPPPGMGSYTASVVALNSDSQSSLFVQQTPPTFTYDPAPAPSVTVSPSVMVPGAQRTVQVQGVNTNFNAQTQVGFGTSDIVVNQVNVLSPTALTITVTPNATVTTNMITITTGLQVISQALGYQVATTDQQLQLTSNPGK
ncbi:MAG TPA: carboxypeptidase regulatory-like domain-containing protein [Bryobacteraceae bacterium]|nr:carboxypeptidase regulatory-like domain-containing protein [Bryobacteraceae bacterium]